MENTDVEDDKLTDMPEAVVSHLQRKMEQINTMGEKEIIEKLKKFHLDTEGDKECLKEKLKNSYKKIILASSDLSLSPCLFPYYVIIDFEATCTGMNSPNFRQEIIEFPAVIVDSKKQQIIDCFQMYCQPQINPIMTDFCTELTGITQEQVDSAEPFDKVLEHFQNWLQKHNLGKKQKFAIVTDGPWDMSRFLFSQCQYSNLKYPKWARRWVNLQRAFSKFYQCERYPLKNMLEFLGMDFIGRPHCGLDDAKNIARVLLMMIYDGANIQINQMIRLPKSIKPKDNLENEEENSINEPENTNKKKRMETNFNAVYYTGKMPVYTKSKRDRLIAEVQIAKKIFTDYNLENETTEKKVVPSKKKSKKKKKTS